MYTKGFYVPRIGFIEITNSDTNGNIENIP